MQKNKNSPWIITPLALAISSFAASNVLASATTDTRFGTNGIASLDFNNLGIRYLVAKGWLPEPTGFVDAKQPIVELSSGDIVSFASRYEETGTVQMVQEWYNQCWYDVHAGTTYCTGGGFIDWASYGELTEGVSKSRMSRFTAGGALVSTVDIDGIIVVSALEQADGKLLLMGNDLHRGPGGFGANWWNTQWPKPAMTSQIVLQRFNADGSTDSTFDTDGSLRISLPGTRQGSGLALMPDGKIVVLDVGFNTTSSNPQLLRFNSDGSIDTTFGGGDGNLPLPIPNAWGMLEQQDNKLLILYNDSYKQAYARFNTDGSLDASFAGDGTLNINQSFFSNAPMLQQSDGKLLLAATNVYRYNLSGIYEQTFTVPAGEPATLLSLAETEAGEILVARGAIDLNGKVDVFNSNGSRNTTVFLNHILYKKSYGEILLHSDGGLIVSESISASGSAILSRHLINNVKNDYNNDGIAGWIWKGVGNGNENASQNWQLTFPLYSNNWAVPNRFYHPVFLDQANWDIVTSGDFNKDGDADILWRNNSTAQWKVWQMQAGLRVAQNDLADFDLGHEWTVIGSGDTDKDGDDDVILNNTATGEVVIWKMQDHALAATHSVGIRAGYTLNRIGDFNKDGDVDLLFRQNGADALITWEIESGVFVTERALFATGAGYNPVCSADFDKDSDDDIMLVNSSTLQEKWFVMENYSRTQRVGGTNTGFNFLGCGDYDGDGDADSLWQRLSDDKIRTVLQQDYGASKQTVYTNPFGSVNGFIYKGNNN